MCFNKELGILVFILFFAGICSAQENAGDSLQNKGAEANEVAKRLANPNAVIGFMGFNFDFTTYGGNLQGAGSQYGFKISFQPSLPIPIAEGTNIFVRPLIPLFIEQPVYTDTGFENGGVALGDIGFDVAVGHTWPRKWITIVGIFGSAPSATNYELSAQQWTLGPEVVVGKTTKWGFLGLLVSHSWGLTSDPNKDYSVTAGQYFYIVNLRNAWQI